MTQENRVSSPEQAESVTHASRVLQQEPTSSSSDSTPEIFLTLQTKNKKYDINNPVPVSKLHESSLVDFFSFVADRSSATILDINCLTFSFIFAERFVLEPQTKIIVHRTAGDDQWEALKEKLEIAARICRYKVRNEKRFDVLVDIGDPLP